MEVQLILVKGEICLIDFEDFFKINKNKWRMIGGKGSPYVGRYKSIKGKKSIILLHRVIMKPEKHQIVDHKNGNTLDNRKNNLRICTSSQNSFNRKTSIKKRGSVYKGVSLDKRSGTFQARIMIEGKRICLGSYVTEKEAAIAYDKKAKKLFKEFACLNFN